ncbi:acyl carrier protein [Xanthomonas sp. NCPPB 1128]|nr:acyl carrier protein [Xanthomonas sp. NCPPB 1128]
MSAQEKVMNVYAEVLSAINEIKRTGFTIDTVEPDFYLGGDLGVDSREMLEIWYELEQRLSVRIADSDKRDRYTLQDVVDVLSAQLSARALVA